jgi:hypothetical protein
LFPLRRVVSEGELNGRKVIAIELASLQAKAGLHTFELESGHLVRVESALVSGAEESIPVTIDFSDFRTVDAITMPFKTVMTNPAMQVTTTIQSVKHNVELDPGIFKARKEQ